MNEGMSWISLSVLRDWARSLRMSAMAWLERCCRSGRSAMFQWEAGTPDSIRAWTVAG